MNYYKPEEILRNYAYRLYGKNCVLGAQRYGALNTNTTIL